MGLGLTHLCRNLAAVHTGHGVVEDDGLDGFGAEDCKPVHAVERCEDLIASPLKQNFADPEADLLIVYAENKMRFLCHRVP